MPGKDKGKAKDNEHEERCSFCGKLRSEVEDMFDGPGGNVRICDQCIALCNIMMAGKRPPVNVNMPPMNSNAFDMFEVPVYPNRRTKRRSLRRKQ